MAADGTVYVTGNTGSANFPTTPDALQTALSAGQDAFVTRALSAGARRSVTPRISVASSQQAGVGLTLAQSLFVVGLDFSSTDFPTAHALQPVFGGGAQDAWLAVFGTPPPDAGQDAGTPAGPDGGELPKWKLVVGCG